jgi:hypothetical protein
MLLKKHAALASSKLSMRCWRRGERAIALDSYPPG